MSHGPFLPTVPTIAAGALTNPERRAVFGWVSHAHPRVDLDEWLDGGPRPPLDTFGGLGSGQGGPWPTICLTVVQRGIVVTRYTPDQIAAWQKWNAYWHEATGGDPRVKWTDDMHRAAPPAPHFRGEFVCVTWTEIRRALIEQRDGATQPSLFAEAA